MHGNGPFSSETTRLFASVCGRLTLEKLIFLLVTIRFTTMPDVQNIDVALLRAFIAVAETGRMTTAARIVHRTQGAVSQQIKRLESLFEARLFDRKAGAARLTREGEKLLVKAHSLIALNDAVMDQMRAVDFTGEVRLGVAHDIVRAMMPPILRRFRQEHSNVLITLLSDTTQALRAALRERKIDLALMTEPERGDRDQFLLTDQLIWVGAKGGDAYHRRPLSVALVQGSGHQSVDESKTAMARDLPIRQFGICVRDVGGGHGNCFISFTDRTGS